MTTKEQMNKILNEIQECEFDWHSMMWFRQELERLMRIAKAEAYKEFAERVKRYILERDDETIDRIKENLIKELHK